MTQRITDYLSQWAESEAARLGGELTEHYHADTIAAFLHGPELPARLAAWLAGAVRERSGHLYAAVQGMEAEMRRAETMLPADWEGERFRRYVAQADATA